MTPIGFEINRPVTLIREALSCDRVLVPSGTVGKISGTTNWLSPAHTVTEFYVHCPPINGRTEVVQLSPAEQGSAWQFCELTLHETLGVLDQWQREQSPMEPLSVIDSPRNLDPIKVEIAVVGEKLLFGEGSLSVGAKPVFLSLGVFHFFISVEAARRQTRSTRFFIIGSQEKGFLLVEPGLGPTPQKGTPLSILGNSQDSPA